MMRWMLPFLILLFPVPRALCNGTAEVLVVLGLPDKLMQEGDVRAQDRWGDNTGVTIATVSELRLADEQTISDARVVLTAGVEGCRYVVERTIKTPVLCSLLSKQSFELIQQEFPRTALSALVLDQPLSRQVVVTSSVFPALQKFSVLTSSELAPEDIPDSTLTYRFDSRAGYALAPSVASAVENVDALVARPDRVVFNRNTIRTVMLTAYGHGKPIIGYSEAYVRAGALLATYSNVRQSFRHAAELLTEYLQTDEEVFNQIHSPRYFSIAVNRNIAKSLKLVQTESLSPERSWQDKDFSR